VDRFAPRSRTLADFEGQLPAGAPGGDPGAAALVGLKRGARDAGHIKQLQDDLLRLGYFGPEIRSNRGYGREFGPKTLAALKQFQTDNGVPASGVVDEATAAALAAPRDRPADFARGPAAAFRDQLGLPKGPARTLRDGSLRQDFDRGYVLVDSQKVRHVRTSAESDIVPPARLGTFTTTEEAGKSFLTQWGPTASNSGGTPYGYNDCGPTSAVMALSSLGLVSHPGPDGAAAAIDSMRDAALGYDSTFSTRMGFAPLKKAIESKGGAARVLASATPAAISESLAQGNPVIVGGNPWAAWGKAERGKGNYLNGRDPGGHFVTLLGKTADGSFIVADPLVKGGPIAVTEAQLKTFLGQGFGAMEVSRP
jgi:peptidoglycan hydrolase-like protein with peptidoglycan-binding domain